MNLRLLSASSIFSRSVVSKIALMGMIALTLSLELPGKEAPAAKSLTVTTAIYRLNEPREKNQRLQSVEEGKPGDILIFRSTYQNTSREVLHNISATMAIPGGLQYVPDPSRVLPTHASKDGESFFLITAIPTDPVAPNWRALRWAPRDVAPLSAFIVELRARVPGGDK